jgi:hypothetical protein
MNSSQNSGKSKSSKSSSSGSKSKSSSSSSKSSSKSKSSSSSFKKGGNFLGSVSELFVPTGWENFATAAGLLAADRAVASFRGSRNSSKKQKGGSDADGHMSTYEMDATLDKMHSDTESSTPDVMNGGGKKKSKTTKSKSKTTKSKTTKSKTTKSKSKSKSKTKTAAKKKSKSS